MKVGFMRTCFGCCGLRTGVLIVAIFDLIFGMFDIVEFCVRIDLDFIHHSFITRNTTIITNTTSGTIHNGTTSRFHHGALYDDSAFAVIVVGCIDIFISSFLLYVAAYRKYHLRVVVFIAAIWSFVFAFLDMVSFAVFIALDMLIMMGSFLLAALMEMFFGYIILSYFKFMTIVVERGIDDINMPYFPEETMVDISGVQMDEANAERPIMEDQDDFTAYDDDQQRLVTS